MSRPARILIVCTGLVFIGSGIQSGRVLRLRATADSLHPSAESLDSVDAEIAEMRATISQMHQQSIDAVTRPETIPRLADALVGEVRRARVNLTMLSIEPDGPAIALSATGERMPIAHLVTRVDALLESHHAYAERFSLAGGHDESARIDLFITPGAGQEDPSTSDRPWPTVATGVVARALGPTRAPIAPGDTDATAAAPSGPADPGIVSWVGTIGAGGSERYVLRLAGEGVVAVLGEGDDAVLGWTVLSRDRDRLRMRKEGVEHEVRR